MIQKRNDRKKRRNINCDWEFRLSYGIAMSLVVFEAKRFFLLSLELFVEWQVIRFAGGYRPVVLTFIDITIGFPCALVTVYTIRKRHVSRFYEESQRILSYLLLVISICVILNLATMASIGIHTTVRKRSIATVFNASMQFYVTSPSYKYTLDQIQFVLQCCGHKSYADWFFIDWQQLFDYGSHDTASKDESISNEIYQQRAVPFSCCNIHVLETCLHYQLINEDDTKTVNVNGCTDIISNVIFRIVFVAYAMTTILVVTQTVLGFFIAVITNKRRRKQRRCVFYNPVKSPNGSSSFRTKTTRNCTGCGNYDKRFREAVNKNVGSGTEVSGLVEEFPMVSTSLVTSSGKDTNRYGAARINPSLHIEHNLPTKNCKNQKNALNCEKP